MRALYRLAVLAFFAAVASCDPNPLGSSSGSTPTHPVGSTGAGNVAVQDDTYTPASVAVTAGETITWTWLGANLHTVTFDNGGPGSAQQSSGTFQTSFATAGTYSYHCLVHGRVMSGTVIVQ